MKKLFVTLFFIVCAMASRAQFQGMDPVPKAFNQVKIGKLLWIATEDTTQVSASSYPGAIIFRKQSGDSAHYVSNGARWIKLNTSAITTALDSARRSNDTLYFRTTGGSEIPVKMQGIEIAGVNGLQDSLSARYTKTQADARFIQGNQTITLSGDVTGSGTTAITTALKNTGTSGTYTKVTTDPEGRVFSGTTLSAGDIPDLSATYIPLTQKGAASGVATLGMDGKVPSSQLPTTGSLYQGTWNASTNTPTIADGVGTVGWYYRVNVAGSQDLGSGSIAFSVGDDVIYNGSVWQRIPGGSAVNSVNGYTGDVVLAKGDVGLGNVDNTSDLAKPVSTATQTALNLKANSAITLTAGTGLTGGGNLTANRSFAVNFGTAAGTVAQGNDSRINNGQTAFGWGNHASAGYLTTTTGDARYPQLSGSYANPSWLSSLAWSKITGAPSSFPTSSDLQTVLGNGNTATNSINLGSVGNGNQYYFTTSRNISSVDYVAGITVGLPGDGAFYISNGTTALTKILYLPHNATTLRYSPDNGTNRYDLWHSNNHPAGTTGSITYTGAEVPSSFSFNSAGHYTASGKRTLTAGDVSAPLSFNPGITDFNTAYTGVGAIAQSNLMGVSGVTNGPAGGIAGAVINVKYDANYGFQLGNTNGQAGSLYFRGRTGGSFGSWLQLADRNWTTSNFASSNIPLNTVLSNGNSSGYQVQITGLNGTPSSGAGLELAGSTTTGYISAYNRSTSTSLPLRISHTGGNTYINEGTGNVGIGTTSPASKLHVNGTITAPVLQSPSGDNLVLLANSAPTGAQVTLTTDGLGIGGMPGGTHTARLFVAGNAVAKDAWVLDDNAGLMGEFFLDGTNGIGIRTISNHDLSLYANDQKRIKIGKEGVITTTAGIASHARLVSTATAFTIQPQDYVVIMEGMGTAAGDGVLITLPDPSTNGGRLLEFHEYSASSWATNYDIYQPVLAPLTTISGVMVIRAVNGKWRLVSKH